MSEALPTELEAHDALMEHVFRSGCGICEPRRMATCSRGVQLHRVWAMAQAREAAEPAKPPKPKRQRAASRA